MNDDLAYMSATEAATLFRARKLSPVELLDGVIARTAEMQPRINAFTFCHFDTARTAARAAEALFGGPHDDLPPLTGLPVAIKDAGHIAGQVTSAGSLTTSDHPASATSPVNARVLEEGGIPFARSATPEFSCASTTHSRRWGITRNPWNTAFTPGGSSGGAGAALAAGMTPLATGSDIGGSIRIPAGCCGVVGYKPPRGRNPVDPPFNLDFYCHTGPLARSVADAILLQNAMCGPHPGDPTTLRPRLVLSPEYGPIRGMRIAVSPDLGFFEVDGDVVANLNQTLQVFRDLGAVVEPVTLPWDWGVIDAALGHLRHIFAASLGPELMERGADMTPYARSFAQASQDSTARDFFASMTRAGDMAVQFGAAMAGYDLLICPTNALPAVPADLDQSRDSVTINGVTVDATLGWVMTAPFNMLSHHPVLSVPSGHAANGVPTGVQIVGQPYDDVTVFRAALAYETAIGGWYGDASTRPSPG